MLSWVSPILSCSSSLEQKRVRNSKNNGCIWSCSPPNTLTDLRTREDACVSVWRFALSVTLLWTPLSPRRLPVGKTSRPRSPTARWSTRADGRRPLCSGKSSSGSILGSSRDSLNMSLTSQKISPSCGEEESNGDVDFLIDFFFIFWTMW